MKKLKARSEMIMTIIGIILAIIGLVVWVKESAYVYQINGTWFAFLKLKELWFIPLYEFLPFLLIIYGCKGYCENWISYGDNKIIIKQKRKG